MVPIRPKKQSENTCTSFPVMTSEVARNIKICTHKTHQRTQSRGYLLAEAMDERLPKRPFPHVDKATEAVSFDGVPYGVPVGVPQEMPPPPELQLPTPLPIPLPTPAFPVMRLDFGGERPSAPSNSSAAPPRRFSSFIPSGGGCC